jgi:hypothetical protein
MPFPLSDRVFCESTVQLLSVWSSAVDRRNES